MMAPSTTLWRWAAACGNSSWPFILCASSAYRSRLFLGQSRKAFHLNLVRQIGNDRPVGLQATQHERADYALQRLAPSGHLLQLLGEIREFLGRSQKPLVERIKKRPEVRQPVFNGCSCHGNPIRRWDLLHCPRLPRSRVLDGLRLIQDQYIPVHFLEPSDPGHHPIGRQDHI